MFLGTAALGTLLDMKPASAKNFTNLFFTPAVGSTSLTSYQTQSQNLPSKMAFDMTTSHYK
jgi:hypothetical protein